MAYIKLLDSEHGEIGHNGYSFVVNHPFAAEERPAPWETRAVECGGGNGWRGLELGLAQDRALVEIPGHLLDTARANRTDYDARHNIPPVVGGIDQVRGGAYDSNTY